MRTCGHADINFSFDPLCPFAWMTSRWARKIAVLRDHAVDWRFISLRVINASVNDEAIGARALDSAAALTLGWGERGSRELVEPLLEQAGCPVTRRQSASRRVRLLAAR